MLIAIDSKIPNADTAFARIGSIRLLQTKEINPRSVADADALIVRSETTVNRDLLNASKISFVGSSTIGIDHVDVVYLQQRKIGFASAPGSNAMSVADYVTAALLEMAAQKNIELKCKTIGIVGVGNTGSRTEAKARALGMRPLLNDPPLKRATGDARYLPLDEVLKADVVTLHVPLTATGEDPTVHLLNAKTFQVMNQGSILINTSRGGVVESSAVKSALQKGRLLGAVLDVWEHEPTIDMELLSLVSIGTAHIAGYSFEGKLAGAQMIFEAMCSHFKVDEQWDSTRSREETIEVDLASSGGASVLTDVVRQVYDIRRDDASLRELLHISDGIERGVHFRKLRATYPGRHENSAGRIRRGIVGKQEEEVLSKLGFKLLD